MADLFWDDLANDLEDPEFLREFITESVRIATADAIVNALDDVRLSAGLSKAELARTIGAEPATVRRLFSAKGVNPTLGTLSEVAAALGMRIAVVPLPPDERAVLTEPLRTGQAGRKVAEQLAAMRSLSRHTATSA